MIRKLFKTDPALSVLSCGPLLAVFVMFVMCIIAFPALGFLSGLAFGAYGFLAVVLASLLIALTIEYVIPLWISVFENDKDVK